ncbi:MAG: C1 family peptidase [Treponema sp.]|jgi:bleomycin hydrolase|nr:C1 family peptidase [Treponema sp.]
MNKEISIEMVSNLRATFLADKQACQRMNSVTGHGIDAASFSYTAPVNTPNTFSVELKTGDITAQKASGRCWLFAATNIMRLEVMKKCELKTFELSQAYLFFWDKFEKANYFLESILDTLDEEVGGRLINWFLRGPFADGGQWDMVAALVAKYGVVPKSAMPESFSSSASARMNKFLTLKVREFARELRNAHEYGTSMNKLRVRKEEMLRIIFKMLCICLGTPPERFDFEERGKEKNDQPGRYTRDLNITPQGFYDTYVGKKLDDYVSLINAPTSDKPFYTIYTVAYLGNVIGGAPVRYLNLPVENLKRAALAQLESGEPVWFGSDVGQMLDMEHGLLSLDAFDVENLFGTPFPLDKAARLEYSESLMNHAMVFQGVNVIDGKPNRWKVENSWGDERGEKGWFRMSDDWFNEYVYQIVVNKRFLTNEERACLDKTPITLKPWDPMGSLA